MFLLPLIVSHNIFLNCKSVGKKCKASPQTQTCKKHSESCHPWKWNRQRCKVSRFLFSPPGIRLCSPGPFALPGPASPGGQHVRTAREGESGGTGRRRGGRERGLRSQASWVWTPGPPLNWWDDLGSSSSPRTQWSQLWNGPITPSTSGHCVHDPVNSYVLSAQDRACPTSFLGIQCVQTKILLMGASGLTVYLGILLTHLRKAHSWASLCSDLRDHLLNCAFQMWTITIRDYLLNSINHNF